MRGVGRWKLVGFHHEAYCGGLNPGLEAFQAQLNLKGQGGVSTSEAAHIGFLHADHEAFQAVVDWIRRPMRRVDRSDSQPRPYRPQML